MPPDPCRTSLPPSHMYMFSVLQAHIFPGLSHTNWSAPGPDPGFRPGCTWGCSKIRICVKAYQGKMHLRQTNWLQHWRNDTSEPKCCSNVVNFQQIVLGTKHACRIIPSEPVAKHTSHFIFMKSLSVVIVQTEN